MFSDKTNTVSIFFFQLVNTSYGSSKWTGYLLLKGLYRRHRPLENNKFILFSARCYETILVASC